MKRIIALTLMLIVIVCMGAPAMAAAPKVQTAQYEGRGHVEVDFRTKVQYRNATVTVKSPSGKTLTVRITDLDDDEMSFHVKGLKPNTRYTYTISGIRKKGTTAYGTVSGTFRTPASELAVRKAKYDRNDGELELELYGRVEYKEPKAVIRDQNGRTYSCRITDLDRDEMEIAVKDLPSGKYTVKISGIRLKGETSYTSISCSFRV